MYWICLFILLYTTTGMAQVEWPRTIGTANGDSIRLYQPQPESFKGDLLKVRTAVSVILKKDPNPVFGCIWIHATMQTDRTTRIVILHKVVVADVRFPAPTDTSGLSRLKGLLEREILKWDIAISLDQLLASLEEQDATAAKDILNTSPPKIIYKNKSSMLVLIDGEPKLTNNKELGVEMVMNTAFIIVKDKKGKYYLFGGGQWFQSAAIAGQWAIASSLPKQIKTVNKKIKEKQERTDSISKVVPEIVISTEPAELIQSNGESNYLPINGTNLLYMSNTNDDIFMDINSQQHYVLLSGRWYKGSSLNGPWSYVPADGLPADFAKIPEGSAKDNVLVSVAGTDAARDALLDAQVPQTAKVDLDKQQQMRDRGNAKANEFNQYNRSQSRPSTQHRPTPARRR